MGGTRKLKMSLVISVFLVAMVGGLAAARTIYVDYDAVPDGNGQSYATAYKYLQDALADGIYTGNGIVDMVDLKAMLFHRANYCE